jgi:tRNA U54 and U55 pseudouridine synthase Pus10
MNEQNERFPTEKEVEDYELLKDMLYSQKTEFSLLSNKKADTQLNQMKIKIANRVLEPLKEIFKNEESYEFLDTLDEEMMPTNSDVVLIFSQYETAIEEFKNKYYIRDRYLGGSRWITQECPPNHYKNEEEYDDEEYVEDEE